MVLWCVGNPEIDNEVTTLVKPDGHDESPWHLTEFCLCPEQTQLAGQDTTLVSFTNNVKNTINELKHCNFSMLKNILLTDLRFLAHFVNPQLVQCLEQFCILPMFDRAITVVS